MSGRMRGVRAFVGDTVPLQTVYPVGKLSTMSGNGAAACFSTLSTEFSTSIPTKTSRFHVLFHTGVENVVEKCVHILYDRQMLPYHRPCSAEVDKINKR